MTKSADGQIGRDLRAQFTRTTCACESCVACCKHMPGALAPGDLERILDHQGQRENATAWLLEHFEAPEGATGLRIAEDGPRLIRVPSIVPRLTENGCVFLLTENGCVFLQDGKCKIHEVAPFGCAYMDTHGAYEKPAQALVSAQAHAHMNPASYVNAWNVLHDAGKDAAPLSTRKAALRDALDVLEGRG
jgi:Fe-S-cluster containining protein